MEDDMKYLFFILSSQTSSSTSSNSSQSSTESLMKLVQSPILYIVLGAIVLLIIVFYLFRRIVKAKSNTVIIVTRKGKIHKTIDDRNPKYFMVPFVDKMGAVISLKEQEFTSDQLFINNGPDHLYKVNYTLTYKVLDAVQHYPYLNNFQKLLTSQLNDRLREFADQGNALILVKDYREHSEDILALVNKAVEEYHIQVVAFKVNRIEPLGR